MTVQHANLETYKIHKPFTFEYINENERLNDSTFNTSDIGKLAQQKDDNTFYVLISIDPIKQITFADKNIYQTLMAQNVLSIQYNEFNKINLIIYTESYSAQIIYNEYTFVTSVKFFKGEILLETQNYEYDVEDRVTSITINKETL